MDQTLNDLKLRLKDLRRKNANDQWFIPQLPLSEALAEDAVRIALQDAGIELYRLDEIAKYILTSGIKIFAILVLTGQAAHISRFIEAGELHDLRLPFGLDILCSKIFLHGAQHFFEVY